MPVLPNKKALTKVEEGEIVKLVEPMFDYFVVSSKQLQRLTEAALEAANFYNRMSESLFGPMQAMFKMQEQIASQIANLSKMVANVFERINFVFPVPRLDMIIPELTPIPIYIQPDEPYNPPKKLPSGDRKKKLPISAIEIVGNGFTVEGEYIKGMTLRSKPGRLLNLMIRRDLQGRISDNLIGQATGEEPADYRAWGIVMRDLKDILMGKKLRMDIERQEELKRYELKSLTKYARRPKKSKKAKNKDLMN